MGACSSCLGRDRDREITDEDESTRLLFDDPHGAHYGSFGDQGNGLVQADPQEVQRETEALQKVVVQTSSHLVDIFALVSQNNAPTPLSILPAHDARFLRYQGVLAKMTTHGQSSPTRQTQEDASGASEGWMSGEDDTEEMKSCKPVKSDGIGRLLGGFADADSAIE